MFCAFFYSKNVFIFNVIIQVEAEMKRGGIERIRRTYSWRDEVLVRSEGIEIFSLHLKGRIKADGLTCSQG